MLNLLQNDKSVISILYVLEKLFGTDCFQAVMFIIIVICCDAKHSI